MRSFLAVAAIALLLACPPSRSIAGEAFEAPLVFAPEAGTNPFVAVFDFYGMGLDLKPDLLERLTEYLVPAWVKLGYRVISLEQARERWKASANDMHRFGPVNPIELGRELCADKVLVCRIIKLGSRCVVTLELVDLQQAVVDSAAVSSGGCSEDSIAQSIDRAAGDRSVGLSWAHKPVARDLLVGHGLELDRYLVQRLTFYLGSLLATRGHQVFLWPQSNAPRHMPPRESKEADTAKKCARARGADLVAQRLLRSQVLKIGTKCSVTLDLVDLKTQSTMAAGKANGTCDEDGIVESLEGAMAQLDPLQDRPSAPVVEVAQQDAVQTRQDCRGVEVSTGPMRLTSTLMHAKRAEQVTLEDHLLDKEIAQLKEILADPASEGPHRADLLFRLAERYYEKASAIHKLETQDHEVELGKWVADREKNGRAPEPKLDVTKSQAYFTLATSVSGVILDKYKDYIRRDEVLYDVGQKLFESGHQAEGMKLLLELIKSIPESRFVPNAFLVVGEYNFDKNDVFNARRAYERAASAKNQELAIALAVYKLAWCDYTLGEYQKSLGKLMQVVALADREARKDVRLGARLLPVRLKALQDLALFFSQLDALETAEKYFVSTLGQQAASDYLRQLGCLFDKQGKPTLAAKAFELAQR